MARKTKVVGFSVPPEIHSRIENFIKLKHKTRSEFFREMIELYFATTQQMTTERQADEKLEIGQADLAKVLRSYWQLKSQSGLSILVTGLAIISNQPGQVLIGERKDKDEIVEHLTWSFPGGQLTSLEFATELKQRVKEATGLDVAVNNLITARVFPDVSLGRTQVVALYFDCSASGNFRLSPESPYRQLKWVKPLEVFNYFTSSTSDEVTRFLASLQA